MVFKFIAGWEVQAVQQGFRVLLAVVLALVVLATNGCAKKEASSTGERVALQYATGFSLESLPGGCQKVIDGEGRALLLVPRGAAPPAGFSGLTVIYTPVERVTLGSTTQAALLRPLGVLDKVVAVTTPKGDWYIEEVKKAMEEGRVHFVGKTNAPDYEKIKALSPGMVFTYTRTMGGTEFAQKLEELKIPYAAVNEWLENHPLGRVEWIKFLAAFFDREREAEDYFRQVVAKVEDVTRRVPEDSKPKVVWGSILKGKVYVPAGNSYAAKMIEMAGGEYVFKGLGGSATGSINITLEEFYARAKEADVWVFPYSPESTGISSLTKLLEQAPVLAETKPVKEKNVWCARPWYWQSIEKVHEQIEDLAAIFYPRVWRGYHAKHFMLLPEK